MTDPGADAPLLRPSSELAPTRSPELLRLKLAESMAAALEPGTRRDIDLPRIPGKVLAVIGVRRGGKTTFVKQVATDAVGAGRSRDSQLLLSLEDERLIGMNVADLAWLVDEHARQYPSVAAPQARAIYLDEIQLVPHWETFVRRLLDAGYTRLFVTGSSATMLSTEIASAMRGRALEVPVHPFSFREALRHQGEEPTLPWSALGATDRLRLDGAVQRYLAVGGFPEAQGARPRDHRALLQTYVDVMILRDVIERHDVVQPKALRWVQRRLLETPGGLFSANKLTNDLKSQGFRITRPTVEAYLEHLAEAFLIRIVPLHTANDAQRRTNPRKAYSIDVGFITLIEGADREHRGRALETAVLLELARRGYATTYLRLPDSDREVDFFAERPGDAPLLVQVCLDASSAATWQREVGALAAASVAYPTATPLLITLDSTPPPWTLPAPLRWMPAAEWLLAPA